MDKLIFRDFQELATMYDIFGGKGRFAKTTAHNMLDVEVRDIRYVLGIVHLEITKARSRETDGKHHSNKYKEYILELLEYFATFHGDKSLRAQMTKKKLIKIKKRK